MKDLYEHQLDLVENVRSTGKRAVLLQAPTGVGKSVIAAYIVYLAGNKGATSWFIVPRKELVRQMSHQYIDFGIEHTFIASGRDHHPQVGHKICSIETLVRRLGGLDAPKLAFIDETHYGGKSLDVVIKWLRSKGTFIIGLSATPWRLDGTGLGCWYDAMVEGPSIKWLIDNGYLSKYRLFAPDHIDLSGIRKVAGDYNKMELADRMENNRVLVGNVVKHYKDHAMGMRGVTFTVSRKHSDIVCEAYNANGVAAACIDGDTPDDERRRLARALATGDLLQLVNVDLLTFGYDLSAAAGLDVTIECMSDLRPTKSLALQMQKWGRVLRRKDNPAIIFDHANNVDEHGMPDEDRVWALADRDRKESGERDESDIAVRTCPVCFYTSRPFHVCPHCGHAIPIQSREVDEVDGELREITDKAEKKKARMEVGKAKTMAELIAIGRERGYASGWAYQIAKVKGIV